MQDDMASLQIEIAAVDQPENATDSLRLRELEMNYFSLNQTFARYMSEMEKKYPKYYDLKFRTDTCTVAKVQQTLNKDAALLEYYVGNDSLYIFAITASRYHTTSVPFDTSLDENLDLYIASLTSDRKATFSKASTSLYQSLIHPVQDVLTGIDNLIIIPFGKLWLAPFEALLVPTSGKTRLSGGKEGDFRDMHYLLQDYNISYHLSAALYLQSRTNPGGDSSHKNFAGYAPVFADKRQGQEIASESILGSYLKYAKNYFTAVTRDGKNLNPLPFTKNEVTDIARQFSRQALPDSCFLYDRATEDHFKRTAGRYRFLHLATHSFIDETRPERSGIAFYQRSDTSSTQEDGILFSGETYNLDLNADLVVLSSCESGLGKLVASEGLMALTRGFLYAGARNIVYSLWKVDDRSTSELMVDFYRHMLAGANYAGALRVAKLNMLKKGDTSRPSLWSGFVLVGE